jgi:peptide subunit release factor 1 (eRF1)
MTLSAVRYKLTKVRLLHLLDELKANSIEVASLCIPPKSPKINIEGLMETIVDIRAIPEDVTKSMADSPTGAMLFWGPHHRYLIMPPFPLNEARVSPACEIDPLNALLQKELLIGLVLVRMGAYGIGIIKGEQLLTSKVGTGLVHARHRQGGSSSHRFERHRDKQMETFFTRVCGHSREQLEPYARQLEYVVYGGTRETLLEFRKQCHFLQQFDNRTLDLLLDIRKPGQSGIQEAILEAWSSRVIQWNE